MALTKEEKQLKEAMKILLRDGKQGRLFEAAKLRYVNLKNDDRISNLSHEIDGIGWIDNYKLDIAKIDRMIN